MTNRTFSYEGRCYEHQQTQDLTNVYLCLGENEDFAENVATTESFLLEIKAIMGDDIVKTEVWTHERETSNKHFVDSFITVVIPTQSKNRVFEQLKKLGFREN